MTDTTPTPSAEMIAWMAQLAGCDEAVHRGQRLGWCITHGMKKRTPWPCPVAVDLAAKIAARDARRDAQTRADECDQIAQQCLEHVSEWYGTDIFRDVDEGDLAAVRTALQARGKDIDNLSAFIYRRALTARYSVIRERACEHRERVQG